MFPSVDIGFLCAYDEICCFFIEVSYFSCYIILRQFSVVNIDLNEFDWFHYGGWLCGQNRNVSSVLVVFGVGMMLRLFNRYMIMSKLVLQDLLVAFRVPAGGLKFEVA